MPKESYTTFHLGCETSPDFPRPPVALSLGKQKLYPLSFFFPPILACSGPGGVSDGLQQGMAKQQVVFEQL